MAEARTSNSPGSKKGGRPSARSAIFLASTSIPTTSCPSSAMAEACPAPRYPQPITGMQENLDGRRTRCRQLRSYGTVAQSSGTVSILVGWTMGVICASSTFLPGLAATTSKVRFWVAPGANSTRTLPTG